MQVKPAQLKCMKCCKSSLRKNNDSNQFTISMLFVNTIIYDYQQYHYDLGFKLHSRDELSAISTNLRHKNVRFCSTCFEIVSLAMTEATHVCVLFHDLKFLL